MLRLLSPSGRRPDNDGLRDATTLSRPASLEIRSSTITAVENYGFQAIGTLAPDRTITCAIARRCRRAGLGSSRADSLDAAVARVATAVPGCALPAGAAPGEGGAGVCVIRVGGGVKHPPRDPRVPDEP